ncbi:MAG: TolC family protein [Candidatus Stygibacter australis]|nr:TolC family protein [Candidatus Stygibacter australis]MDP8321099.1 TolC family protein [Candidatus Stygibacter australis]
MKKLIFITLITLLIASLSAVEVLSLDDALKMATSNNPELKAAENNMKAAEKSMQSSYLALGPSASLSGSKVYLDPGSQTIAGTMDETSSYGISASQPIFNGGKVLLSAQIANNTYKIQKTSYQSKLFEITAAVEQKYFAVQGFREQVKALEKKLEQSTTNLEIAHAKREAGLFSNAEYLQMRSEKLSSELDLMNVQNAYGLGKLALANYLGYTESFEVEEFDMSSYQTIMETLKQSDPAAQKDLENQLIEIGKKQNPTIAISRISIDTAEKAKTMAGSNLLPSLNLSYSYDWSNSNLNQDFDGSGSLALIASMPIFPLADNALDYQSARYQLKSSENNFDNAEDGIILAIRSSYLNLITTARQVESAKVNNELAWETWNQMRESFEQGLISSTDLLSTEVMVINSDYNYISARQGFLESISSLKNLLGMDDKEQLIKLIENMEE